MANNVEKVDGKSKDVWSERLEKLQQEFPEILSENKVDCEQLKKIVGDENVADGERYQFSWAGKSSAFREIKKRTTTTLKSDKEESVNFENTENLFLEGENLKVLKILQKAYYGKVKMIYIDPPYNTGNDFIYNDRFAEKREDYEEKTGDVDEEGKKLRAFRKNTKESGHYHSNWLSMMYPRLYLARNLLRENGVIFVSIDDNEVHNLRMIMNEIFGEENFVAQIIWKSKYGAGARTKGIIELHEYIVCYMKDFSSVMSINTPLSDKALKIYSKKDEKFEERGPYGTWPLETTSMADRPNLRYQIAYQGEEIWPKKQWLWSKERVNEAMKNNEIVCNKMKNGKWSVRFKGYLKDEEGKMKSGTPISVIDDIYTQDGTAELNELFPNIKIFDFPKPSKLIKRLLAFTIETNDSRNAGDDIVLDFFAGSATTAHAVMDLNAKDGGNRKYIMVQLPEETDENSEARKAGYETIADIAKERIRRAGKRIKQDRKDKEGIENLDIGFKAFKLSPSNFKAWRREEIENKEILQQKLEDIVDNLKKGAKKENMLFELMLKLGISPNAKVEDKNGYYNIEGGEYVICLADEIDKDLVEDILSEEPRVFVCLDSAFGDNDELKTNTALQMKSKDIEFKVV